MEAVKKLETKFIREYIEETLSSNLGQIHEIKKAKYHHNSNYEKAPSILKNSILSLRRLQELDLIQLTERQMEILDDNSSHINGIDGVSLSVVGLNDLSKKEDEYNPFNPQYVDFIISDEVAARRYTKHYGNEYVTHEPIELSHIKAIDFRLIQFMEEQYSNISEFLYEDFLHKYNTIIKVAKRIREKELDIMIREMSDSPKTLDIEKVSKLPYLVKTKRR